jgi:transcriptional regulator with XRE-family HTH domain
MSLPDFSTSSALSVLELRIRIGDRVRVERRRLKLSQVKFATECQIPIRTYKRFEQGKCDSLEAFLRVVMVFQRTAAIELLFPPKPPATSDTKSLFSVLERLMGRAQELRREES